MSGPIEIVVTPVMQNGHMKWDISTGGNHGTHGGYPSIAAGKGSTPMTFTIQNGGGWAFAKDAAAIWVSNNGQDPTGPSSVPSEIDPSKIHTLPGNTVLQLIDTNAVPGQLHYTLNFVKGAQTSSTLDPIIENGGPGRSYYSWYAIGAVALLVLLLLVVRNMQKNK